MIPAPKLLSTRTVKVLEKYSGYWPAVALGSALVCFIIYTVSLLVSDVLIEGILRFLAFILFALSVLSFLKWRDGQMSIELTGEPEKQLTIRYRLRKRVVLEESFDLNALESVRIYKLPARTSDWLGSACSVQIRRRDDPDWLYLTSVHGRVLPLDREAASRVITFIEEFIPK